MILKKFENDSKGIRKEFEKNFKMIQKNIS